MRARTIWCTTLLLLCHSPAHAQTVTTELPQAPSPQSTTAPPEDSLEWLLGAPDILNDPGFAPPQSTGTPAPGAEPDASDAPPLIPSLLAPSEFTIPAEDDDAAVPIEAPPGGVPVHIEAGTQRRAGEVYTLDRSADKPVFVHYRNYLVYADHAVYHRDTAQ
jgi:hypothetical protein